MNEFLAQPTFAASVLYYGACLFNFLAALWMVVFFQRHRGVDPWVLRFPVLLIGLFYIIVTVSMFKRIEFAPHASHLSWWWAVAAAGVVTTAALITDRISAGAVRVATYAGALFAAWGSYVVFTEQAVFGEVATYYGFFGANLAAATWVMINAATNPDLMRNKRIIYLGAGAVYSVLVLTAVFTMKMVLESPY